MLGCYHLVATRVIAVAILLSFALGFVTPQAAMAAPDRIAAWTEWQDYPAIEAEPGCFSKNSNHPLVVTVPAKAKCKQACSRCRSQSCIGDYMQPALRVDCPALVRRVSAALPAAPWIDVDLRQIPPPPKPGLS